MELLKKIKVKEWLFFLVILFFFLYSDYLVLASYYMTGHDLHTLTLADNLAILFSKYIVLIAIFIIKDRKYLKEKWLDFVKNFKKYSVIAFKNWFAGFLIMIISNIIISNFIKGIGDNESAVQSLIMVMPVVAFLLTTIFAPFIEEMIFRKYLKDCVNSKLLYMILSGFIFGLVHTNINANLWEILLIIPYGALGFMFAKTVNETENIYPTIMMHMFHNGVLTLLAIGGL